MPWRKSDRPSPSSLSTAALLPSTSSSLPGLGLTPARSLAASSVTRSHVVLRRMEAELALPWRRDMAAVEEAEVQAEAAAMARAVEEAEAADAEAAKAAAAPDVSATADATPATAVHPVPPPPPTPEEQARLDRAAEWKRQTDELAAARVSMPVAEASSVWQEVLSSAFATKVAAEEAAVGDDVASADLRVPAVVSRLWMKRNSNAGAE
uniref:Uncharacterized protein n=1 Tax=Sexangularia sp. CB-2014 TaxID=1486929 RepID=A0A7S1VME5_9EUKA